MFLAMNRFRVKKGSEAEFEAMWLGRESKLPEVPGFVAFHLLKGPEKEDHVLYASHTVWQSEAAFTAWTRSEAFRAAHAGAGAASAKVSYIGSPELETFTALQSIGVAA